jgi:hypothetical protein
MASPPFDIDETKPANTDVVSQHPADERDNRDIIESWLGIDHDTDGFHDKVTLPERGSDPSSVADTGFVYSKDASALTELFYEDSAGTVVQLTEGGAVMGAFATGTEMLFAQAAAPTGWTQNVTWNDRVLRVVSGSGGGTGGSWTLSGVTVDSHVLIEAEMPAHVHTETRRAGTTTTVLSGSISTSKTGTNTFDTGSTGDDGGHVHGLTSDAVWRPSYVDLIVATKD